MRPEHVERLRLLREARGKQPRASKPPRVIKPSCQHRGELLRLETCPGCRGEVQVKVYACDLHGECTLGKRLPGVHMCDDGKPAKAVPDSLTGIPVFMTAAPRDAEVQRRSIESVSAAGFKSLMILAEPGTNVDPHPTAIVLQHIQQQGQWRNLIAALRAGIESGAACFITMEDDVVLHRQTAELLAKSTWPSVACGCLQLYSSARLRSRYRRGARAQLRKQDALDLLGCCALLFSRAAAQELVEWADTKGWRGDTNQIIADPAKKKAGDTFVGEVLTQQGYEIWIHNPSLAEHIGTCSTMGRHHEVNPNRLTLDFPGQDADLFSIFTTRTNMKIAAIYKTFDGGEFIDASLASVYEHCDAIVMVHSDVSWLREQGNTVRAAAIAWCEQHDQAGKVHHLDVSLDKQESQYEAGINYLAEHKIPCDVVLAVDADEVWEDQYFENARKQMTDQVAPAYRSNMHTYLKSPFFRVAPPFGSPTVFFRDPRQLLKSPRGCMSPAIQLADVWMHHYTYVRESRDAVEWKIKQSCFADGGETIEPGWMERVYDRLPAGENLHAFSRWLTVWHRVEKVWLSELPPAMRAAKLLPLWLPEGHLLAGEQTAIYRHAKGRAQAIDLGTYQGLSAAVLSLACKRVHTVDAYDGRGYADTIDPARYATLTGHSLSKTQALCERLGNATCEQADAAEAGRRWAGGPVDVVFIDADHSEHGTQDAVNAWLPHVVSGGLVIFHDVNEIHPGVVRTVESLFLDRRVQFLEPGEFAGSLAVCQVLP